MIQVNTLPTNLAGDIGVQLKPRTCFHGAEGVCEHPQRQEVHTQNAMFRQVLVTEYTKVMEADVIFRIVVQVHKV